MTTSSVPQLQSGYVDLGGLRLHHTFAGDGEPPVLFVHGLGSAGYIEWRFNLRSVGATRRVLAPDLPGYGRSDKPAARYSISYFADALQRYLEAVEISRLDLVGASLGGRVAVELTLRNRSLVRRLTLVNSLGLGRPRIQPFYPLVTIPRVGETVMRVMGTGLRRASPSLVRRVVRRYVGSDAELEKVIDDSYLADMREMHADAAYPAAYLSTVRSLLNPAGLAGPRRLLRSLAASRVPVLLIWGGQDRLFPVEHASRAHSSLPRSRLAIVSGAGHTPQAERPDEFNRLLLEFLAE